MRISRLLLFSLWVLGLPACAPVPTSDAASRVEAPVLRAQWWQTEFYGYDHAGYRLRQESGSERHKLFIDLSYGGSGPDFRHIEWSSSTALPVRVYEHSAERCQVFGGLQSRCLYRDKLGIDLPPALLAQAQQTGLTFTLRAKSGAGRELPLSGEYIKAYLQACAAPKQPR